ncbi:NAD-dependent epimerase/dehydratase family protein [Chromobacterium sp. IIBBL 290-4]|uniref:NAD-dependent epimerase/dehydratase family protein n=1 Tax=Chromobacterium sp. IIBBL 290-4 TaxID=2953890 RepID=UPI0020B8EF80|nr:NAD-dependent epimerase/dehydratase family protein [Chromobacterium sp. IIBBL 290-4]UTH76401.1 NAD-dependent epimerase/dehydratase family protein [Chromobacterium sp. IIBBL 290-4]
MTKKILIIGGTRYFGRLLVGNLIAAGHRVTLATRGRSPDDFGSAIERIQVDRADSQAMAQAFRHADFDVAYDQVCYTPHHAALAEQIFSGRVGRYVMASTIEVYAGRAGAQPCREETIDLQEEAVEAPLIWQTRALTEANYADGKRQAETWLHRRGKLPAVTVRIGHVQAENGDFTERLAQHIHRARQGIAAPASARGGSSFIHAASIAHFLQWAGEQTFLGAVNAADNGALSAADLDRHIAAALDLPPPSQPAAAPALPYDYAAPFAMSTQRAVTLGYAFADCRDWLAGVIRAQAQER